GLPPGQTYTLTDTLPYAPLRSITLEQALDRAYANRFDLKAAESQVRAAELAHSAAQAERYPTAQVNANYGAIGPSPANAATTFAVGAVVRVPIFDGGRISGDIQQADAARAQRRAEYVELRARIDAEVRT